jgi:DNA-binding CsgD family transcriptional regulator
LSESLETAVLSPGGRVQHAAADARAPNMLAALRDAARRIDRARSKARGDPSEALTLWQGLVAGRWSLVDRFETDGRRYVIARENQPHVGDPRALSLRERQVLAYSLLGHPLKLIAYELGLSVSAVSQERRRALRKLGAKSIAEAARLVGKAPAP